MRGYFAQVRRAGLARFRSTWDAFGTFLRDSGMLDGRGGEVR